MPDRAGGLSPAGGPARLVFEKWGGRRHWEMPAQRLGDDEHGTWLGIPAGTPLGRPGMSIVAPQHFVALVPDGPGFVARFYDAEVHHPLPGGAWEVDVYVDVTTPPRWDGDTVTATDLDLDVIRSRTGRTWVDDEDEFAEHRQRYGYPDDVVRAASATCDAVLAAVAAGDAPFDRQRADAWLSRLRSRRAS